MMSEPPIDSKDLQERTLGNDKLQAELLSLFQQHAGPLLETLRSTLVAGDLPAAAKAAHRLAGSAATVSARTLNRQILALEEALTASDADWARAALPAAEDSLSATMRQIERLLDRSK